MTAGATSVDAGSVLAALLLFGLLGLIGQGIRAVVGLKERRRAEREHPNKPVCVQRSLSFVELDDRVYRRSAGGDRT